MRRLTLATGVRAGGTPRARQHRPSLELLEDRIAPTVGFATPGALVVNSGPGFSPLGGPSGFTPAQISQAYGFNQIFFQNGTVRGDGSGQTIAIVDAYNQPNIAGDLQAFDAAFGLPAPPSFSVVNQNGGSSLPPADQGWGLEISLDVEWAHAMAPGANIVLVEANSNSLTDLMAAVDYARNAPGVSVVSMSWGSGEWSGESGFDSHFTTPAGHPGVTFIASSGDSGSSGAPEYPSVSPNVIAVGGTQLTTDGSGNYIGETGWSGSGGGLSSQQSQPGYQRGVVTQSSTARAVPDVAYDGSSGSPFAVYDSPYGGWIQVYGTSAGAPQWASLIAIANQGRQLAGEGTLDGPSQTLPMLYQLPQSDFHDITSGSNGSFSAGPGYDLVTGRGSPYANLIVAGLVGTSGQPSNAPWVTSPATANPNPITGTTTSLSVRGDDAGGASSLTYTWSVVAQPSGAQAPTFSANGSNAAQNSTVTFYAAGTYTFQATLTDLAGHTAVSDVTVIVGQTLTSIVVSPGAASVQGGGLLQFTATGLDQFGHAMNVQPGWTWSVSGPGSVNASGVYSAPLLGAGGAVVKVSAGGLSTTATVTFAAAPPYFPGFPGVPGLPGTGNSWTSWLKLIDAWMAEFALFQSLWQAMLAARPAK